MKQYKSKDFLRRPIQNDTMVWESSDKQFTITTTTNQWAQYFVYVNHATGMEWVGIKCDSLDEAIEELNRMIETEEIEKYI